MSTTTESVLRLAMIGLDTSHVEAFTRLLHDPAHPHHVPGARVVAAYPGGSDDFALSRDRVAGFTRILETEFGVRIFGSPIEAAREADAILIESVDGRVHAAQFREVADLGKPVFIDKPFALTATDAKEIASVAIQHGVPLMSSSALRFATALTDALSTANQGRLIGADFHGPMALEPTQPGFFWYGIHSAEMLFTALGRGGVPVSVHSNASHDLLVAQWPDGRIGTVRGNRCGNSSFGGMLHFEKGSVAVDVASSQKPFYASLLAKIIEFFRSGHPSVPPEESIEIVDFLERANQLRTSANAACC